MTWEKKIELTIDNLMDNMMKETCARLKISKEDFIKHAIQSFLLGEGDMPIPKEFDNFKDFPGKWCLYEER